MATESGADRALIAGATEPVSRLGPTGFDHGELEALAVRCEQATGPDGALDTLIADAVFPPVWGEKQSDGARYNRDYLKWERLNMSRPTASLDAAMTLTNGAKVTLQTFGAPGPMALVDPNERFTTAATLPLALCAAALRAIAAGSR